jgi:flagellar protein FlbD
MIQLTRLNNLRLVINCDLIKFVETAPDTVLTLVSGEKILVRETPDEVLEKIVKYRRQVMVAGEKPDMPEHPQTKDTGSVKFEVRPLSDSERGSDRG